MTDVEAIVQRYYGDRPVLQRIEDALLAAHGTPFSRASSRRPSSTVLARSNRGSSDIVVPSL